jgi:release factor glutamine methyltransferase
MDRLNDQVLSGQTLRELLASAAKTLVFVAERPRFEAELIWSRVLGVSRAVLLAVDDQRPMADLVAVAQTLISRRATGEPMAYVLGTRGFWSLDLQVSPDVLIPRPETEGLVEWALELLPKQANGDTVADLGTGSGAIALAVASERPAAHVIATDRSVAALAVARQNAEALAINNVEFRAGDWFEPLLGERFQLLLSNPPYIAEEDTHLPALRFEPQTALVSGADGFDDLRRIIDAAPGCLVPGGWLLLEHGAEQGAGVRELLRAAGFEAVTTRRDLADLERHSGGRRP